MTDPRKVYVNLLCGCAAQVCGPAVHKFATGRYVGREAAPEIVAAYLDLDALQDEEDFEAKCRRISKGGIHADVKKSNRAGYTVHPFPYPLHIPDIFGDDGIHRSKETRNGNPMKPHYLKTVEEAGGAPQMPMQLIPFEQTGWCGKHWRIWFGVFKPEPGYVQGNVETGERLVGYIQVVRFGAIALYSMIIGHGEHLPNGIMGYLHSKIVCDILQARSGKTTFQDPIFETYPKGDLQGIVYAGYYQGGYYQGRKGLNHWKKKALFEPVHLYLGG